MLEIIALKMTDHNLNGKVTRSNEIDTTDYAIEAVLQLCRCLNDNALKRKVNSLKRILGEGSLQWDSQDKRKFMWLIMKNFASYNFLEKINLFFTWQFHLLFDR